MERKHTKKVIEYDSKRTEYDPAFFKSKSQGWTGQSLVWS